MFVVKHQIHPCKTDCAVSTLHLIKQVVFALTVMAAQPKSMIHTSAVSSATS